MHCWSETNKPVLQNVIRCPALEHLDNDLLAKSASDEDKGYVGIPFLGQIQGGQTVEARQRIIQQDQVGGMMLQFPQKIFPRFHASQGKFEAALA